MERKRCKRWLKLEKPKKNNPSAATFISERTLQGLVFEWLSYLSRTVRELTFAIPNGAKRDIRTAISLKKQGLTAGVPDICMAIPHGGKHGLFIELKVGYNKPTKHQLDMIEKLRRQGYACFVCYSFEDTKQTILDYLKGHPFIDHPISNLKTSGSDFEKHRHNPIFSC